MLACWLGKICINRRPLVESRRGTRVHAQRAGHMSTAFGMRLRWEGALDEQPHPAGFAESAVFVGYHHSPQTASARHPRGRNLVPDLLAGLAVAGKRAH